VAGAGACGYTSDMNRRAGGLLLGSALVALAAPAAGQEWRGPEELEVRVEDAKGRGLAGAEVVLEYAGRELGGPAPMLTDAKGRLAVGGLLPGRWALEVRKPGYMSFRAEIALAGDEKPEIVLASQHNVPGAVSTMRVRIARSRGAPPAPVRVERAAPAPPARAGVAPAAPAAPAHVAPPSAPAPAAPPPGPPSPASVPAERAPAPPTAATAPALPTPTAAPLPTPAAPVPASESAPPTPRVPAPPARPAAPAARVMAAAPIARACYECRPGESALLAESEIAAGGAGCPSDLAARLASLSRADLVGFAASLPGGCAVMVVDLPANARYVGFRFEAAGGNGRSEDCLPGRECPAGACRFPSEPVIREESGATWLLAAFESAAARRGGFTVYWRRTR